MTERGDVDDLPSPGTPLAVERGCTCSVRDGEPVQSTVWPGWLVRKCPLHDQPAAST